ncbi:MAG: LON peptidase substrate-binding domain-containing protein [Acidobacteria bacterium]|nr:LON peptidase substrate-binding domain-containing protein [Acidobacteriota bacterium]
MKGISFSDGPKAPPPETVKVPDVIPIFPLPRVVLLPAEVLPLHVFEPRYVEMVRDAFASHRVIGMVEVLPGHERELAGSPPVREVGCVGFIAAHEELEDGRFLMWLLGLERFLIEQELDVDTSYRQVRVHYQPTQESPKRLASIRQLRQELRTLLPDLVELDEASREHFARHMDEVSDAQLIALASQILEIPSDRKQAMLEAGTLSERFLMVYEDLYRHLDVNPEFDSFNPDELN